MSLCRSSGIRSALGARSTNFGAVTLSRRGAASTYMVYKTPKYPYSKEKEEEMWPVAPYNSKYYVQIPDDTPGFRRGPKKNYGAWSERYPNLPLAAPAKIQWAPAKNDQGKGYLYYERYYSRDERVCPQFGCDGDTYRRLWKHTLKHNYELYPLFIGMSLVTLGLFYTIWRSFQKIEIDLSHYKSLPVYHWERCGPDTKVGKPYWKHHGAFINGNGMWNSRNEMLEILQGEMLAAAKAKGAL